METTVTSKFSWNRVGMIARYYYPSLKLQLLLYPLVSVVFGILTYISTKGNMDINVMGVMGVLVLGVIGMTQPFMLYFAPGFLVKSSRDIDVSIPALWTEKATFILLYFFIAVPILLYMPGKLCFILLQLIFQPETFDIYARGATLYFGSTTLSVSSLSDIIPLTVFAFVLFRAPKPSFGKAALFSIISLVTISIIMGIAVLFIIGINDGFSHIDKHSSTLEEVLLSYDWIYSILCGLISALFIGLTAYSFKRIQL